MAAVICLTGLAMQHSFVGLRNHQDLEVFYYVEDTCCWCAALFRRLPCNMPRTISSAKQDNRDGLVK